MRARDAIRTVYVHKVYNLRSKLGSFGMLQEVTEIALHVWSACACKEARASRTGSGTSCNQAGRLGSGQTWHTRSGMLRRKKCPEESPTQEMRLTGLNYNSSQVTGTAQGWLMTREKSREERRRQWCYEDPCKPTFYPPLKGFGNPSACFYRWSIKVHLCPLKAALQEQREQSFGFVKHRLNELLELKQGFSERDFHSGRLTCHRKLPKRFKF